MAIKPTVLVHHLRRLASQPLAGASPDSTLLGRFVQDRDEQAFAALVERHGPKVLQVCRRVLADRHAAEDAFQATFLVLARRAAGILHPQRLAGWLHGVARRIALKARTARCRSHVPLKENLPRAEREASSPDPLAELTARELLDVLNEEVQRLPEVYRWPVLLCCLDGHSQEEAARLLGWKPGSVKGRLERGRARLRQRLARRGLSLSGALAAALVGQEVASAAVHTALVGKTVAFAVAGGVIPGRVLTLAEAGMKGMTMTRAKITLGVVLLAGLLVAGVGLAVFQVQAQGGGPAMALSARHQKPPEEKPPRTDLHGDPLPEGAQTRLGTIRFRHDHSSFHLKPAFSPDGKMLATGGSNGIHLWDPATGKRLREIPVRYGDYSEPFFAADGRRLIGCRWLGPEASRQGGQNSWMVRLWDPETGRPLLDFPTDGKAAACSPDGKLLATAPAESADEGSVSLWDMATGKRTAQLRGGHKKAVTQVAFSADGKGLVTFCVNRRVCHWDVANGRLEKTVELTIPRQVHGMCLSPDGRSLAVSPRGGELVFVLDTTTGQERFKLQGKPAPGGFGLAFSPDGKILATSQVDPAHWGEQTEVAFWDAVTGKLLRHFPMPARAALHFCFAPDGRSVVIAGQQPLFHLWDVTTGKPVHKWAGHEAAVATLAFTPDGSALVSASDGAAWLWDVKTGRQSRELQSHRGNITGLAVTPDGQTIVSGGIDGCVRLQGLDGKETRRLLVGQPPEGPDPPENQVYALGLSPDGRTAATWGRGPKANLFYHVWDLSTGKVLVERPDPAKVISTRTFSPDARLVLQVVFGGEGNGGPGDGGGSTAAPADSTLAMVEDVAGGNQVLTLVLPKRASGLEAFAADGRSLATASFQDKRQEDGWHYDNTLHLWELASRKVRQTVTWSGRGRFIHAALSPDGRTLATAHDDRAIQFWDLATGKELCRRDGFTSPVQCLAFSPDSRSLASGHGDGTILVWDGEVGGERQKDTEAKPDQRRIQEWWSDLADDDAGKAYRAIGRLASAPGPTVDWLRDQLQPFQEVPADQLRSVLADLDSDDFTQRQTASKQLASLADRASPALRAALNGDLSKEQRQRIEAALEALKGVPPTKTLRDLRAVETLERIATPEAKKLLETLSHGAPESRLTREAKATLERLRVKR